MDYSNLPKTYLSAKQQNSKWYFTGVPCPRGHLFPRFTSTRACKECCRENIVRTKIPKTTRKRHYKNLATFKVKATEVHAGWYSYDRFVYTDAHTPSAVTCPIHGDFNCSPTNHTFGKGCPTCGTIKSAIKQTKSFDDFLAQARLVWGDKFDYSDTVYVGARRYLEFRCTRHNKVVKQTPNNHLSGQDACPSCNHKKSRQQEQIAAYMESLGFVVQQNVTDKSILGRFEADIWIPELRLAIEHHGLYYHKGVEDKHRDKWEIAVKNGVRLVQVFEDEWAKKQDVIKSRLEAISGKAVRRFARKLIVGSIDSSVAKGFLEKHHLQGHGKCSMAYGLFDSSQLVAVATFCKARSGAMTNTGGDGWEVLRYASVGRVVGGFGKLLKVFMNDHKPSLLVSYCDLRYGDGELYRKTGFTLESITPPDYWWVCKSGVTRIPRYQTQKHKLKTHPVFSPYYSDDKTEREICEAAGYEKLHGVGNQKWVLRT